MHDDERNDRRPLEELDGSMRAAVEHIRQEPVPEEALHRALHKAVLLGSPARANHRRLRRAMFVGVAVAATILLGVFLAPHLIPKKRGEQIVQPPSKERDSSAVAQGNPAGQAVTPRPQHAYFAPPRPVAFSPARRLIAYTGPDQPIRPGDTVNDQARAGDIIHVWDVANSRELCRLKGHSAWVAVLAVSPDGKLLASGSDDGTLRLWEVATGKEVHQFRIGPPQRFSVMGIVFSPDGRLLASLEASGEKAVIRLREAATGKELHRFEGQYALFPSFAISADGKTLVAASDEHIHVWEVESGKELRRFPRGHTQTVTCVAFARDGKTFASGGADGTVRLWETATGKELHQFQGNRHHPDLPAFISAVAFSPDGKLLAGASHGVSIWETATGKERSQFPCEPGGLAFLSFGPDGKTLASVGGVMMVVSMLNVNDFNEVYPQLRLWEVETGKERAVKE